MASTKEKFSLTEMMRKKTWGESLLSYLLYPSSYFVFEASSNYSSFLESYNYSSWATQVRLNFGSFISLVVIYNDL